MSSYFKFVLVVSSKLFVEPRRMTNFRVSPPCDILQHETAHFRLESEKLHPVTEWRALPDYSPTKRAGHQLVVYHNYKVEIARLRPLASVTRLRTGISFMPVNLGPAGNLWAWFIGTPHRDYRFGADFERVNFDSKEWLLRRWKIQNCVVCDFVHRYRRSSSICKPSWVRTNRLGFSICLFHCVKHAGYFVKVFRGKYEFLHDISVNFQYFFYKI